MLAIGETFPDMRCVTTQGAMESVHEYFAGSWVVFVTQFGPPNGVGTTELGDLERVKAEFEAREARICVLGCGPQAAMQAWAADVHAATGYSPSYPIIFDDNLDIARKLNLVPPDRDALRDNLRTVLLLSPQAVVRLVLRYPAGTGFSTFEILRCLDSLRRHASNVQTPVNWVQGRDVLLDPDVGTADALRDFPAGVRTVEVPSGAEYLRLTPDPEQIAPPPAASPGTKSRGSRSFGDAP